MNNNLDYPYHYDKEFGSPAWARTTDILINSQALYQLSYREKLTICIVPCLELSVKTYLVDREGIEPTTNRLRVGCSTN